MTPLLSVRGLSVEFPTREGPVRAVEDLSFDMAPGDTLALVGESGSGKSTVALALLRLIASPGRMCAVRFYSKAVTSQRSGKRRSAKSGDATSR